MAAGLGVLRLPPSEFWASTPREIALAIRGLSGGGHTPLSRAALDALMRLYPDE